MTWIHIVIRSPDGTQGRWAVSWVPAGSAESVLVETIRRVLREKSQGLRPIGELAPQLLLPTRPDEPPPAVPVAATAIVEEAGQLSLF